MKMRGLQRAEKLRVMGAWFRANGFSPYFDEPGKTCGCFMRAANETGGYIRRFRDEFPELMGVIGDELSESGLIDNGWTGADATADAAAACDIAADLAERAP